MSASEHQPQTPDTEQLRHDDNLRTPFDEQGQLTAEYLNELTETSLDQGTIEILENLLTRDFVLGYYKDAEVTELKWLIRVVAQRVFCMHPDNNTIYTGNYRSYLYEDDHESLEPLSDREQEQIRLFIKGIFARSTRSREGWQQDKIGEQVKVSRVEETGDNGSDGILGRVFT